jgi:hypothetical protein
MGPDEVFEAEDGVEVVAPEQVLPALDGIFLPAQPLFEKDVVRVRIEHASGELALPHAEIATSVPFLLGAYLESPE